MIILTIRTDKPEAEIGIYDGDNEMAYKVWQAHRELAETLHASVRGLLTEQKLSLKNIKAIVCYKGPGSFTGLRIGLSVGNAMSYALDIPIVSSSGENWRADGIARIKAGDNEKIALPAYGADVHITSPKH